MSSPSAIMNDIENQEADSPNSLSGRCKTCWGHELLFAKAKLKARQQLEVSEDSPFRRRDETEFSRKELQKLREDTLAMLKRETEEIKRQYELVRSRLSELALSTRGDQETASEDSIVEPTQKSPHAPIQSSKSGEESSKKLRPLTGRADCPNCSCDRRISVCNQCINLFPSHSSENFHSFDAQGPKAQPNSTRWPVINDERPIRPAKDHRLATVEVLGEAVVPNRLYTISKSLNNQRTKLAEAINDLQTMMLRVKERENKLDRERKVVKTYKDQWKYGPYIGGPTASPRDRLGSIKASGKRHYESRLDSRLSGDIHSVMGFQNIESSMKLRQYNPIKRPPAPAKHTQIRSKSLESLNKSYPSVQKQSISSRNQLNNSVSHGLKSRSEVNLSSPPEELEINIDESAPNKTDHNDVREEIEVTQVDDEDQVATNDPEKQSASGVTHASSSPNEERVKKISWIPVFGETEIKTVRRTEPKRKIQIVEPRAPSRTPKVAAPRTLPQVATRRTGIVVQPEPSPRAPSASQNAKTLPEVVTRPKTCDVRVDQTMVDAGRRLKTATQLLQQEQQNSKTTNQIIINKAPTPRPRVSIATNANKGDRCASGRSNGHQMTAETYAKSLVNDASEEISRLEEKIVEQQRLLREFIQSQDRQQVIPSPLTVRCSSPCCHRTVIKAPARSTSAIQPSNRSLINSLREKLNKTKTSLARTLEEEREKHAQLRLKVDSSLRKQSDLENENELLKQSLSRCIDTCLRDISSTFESLSETLTDSMVTTSKSTNENTEMTGDDGSTEQFKNAAKLIEDNRHLRQIKSHIESIEQQRRGMSEELTNERQRTSQLEAELKKSKDQLEQLVAAKRRLETQLEAVVKIPSSMNEPLVTPGQREETNQAQVDSRENQPQQYTTRQQQDERSSDTQADKSTSDDTYSSIERYRHYIESMSPDIEAIRRERKMILSEFDNMRKMLANLDGG